MKHKALYGDGSKRLRPEGCWSHCGNECAFESIGCCRTFIPKIECDPPNQGQPDLRGLVFGKRDYDDEVLAWEKARMQLVDKARKKGVKIWDRSEGSKINEMLRQIPDWRPSNDPFALVPIYMDPRRFIKGDRFQLWNPDRFQDAIMSNGEVITAISEAVKYDEDMTETEEYRILRGKLIALFGNLFTSTLSTGNQSMNRAVDVFMSAVDIVCVWCLEQCSTDQEYWMSLVMKYGKVKTEEEVRKELNLDRSSLHFFVGTNDEFEEESKKAKERKEDIERRREEGRKRKQSTRGIGFEFQ